MKRSIVFNSWWFWHLTTMIMLITIMSYLYIIICTSHIQLCIHGFFCTPSKNKNTSTPRSFLLEELHSSWSYQPVTLCSKPLTLPETNSKSIWKWKKLKIRSFPFGVLPIFRGELLLVSVDTWKKNSTANPGWIVSHVPLENRNTSCKLDLNHSNRHQKPKLGISSWKGGDGGDYSKVGEAKSLQKKGKHVVFRYSQASHACLWIRNIVSFMQKKHSIIHMGELCCYRGMVREFWGTMLFVWKR